ncbi:MAG: ABC transporter permease [Solirubrobacterales bacterium]|nr:ABC transporter permease [Solirubrobacterales bacterium]MBV9423109.1 ABC transporter permease [Solirubrobacterales bacterium]
MSTVGAEARADRAERPSLWVRLGAVQRRFQLFQIIALVALFEWGTWTVTDFATKQSVYSMLVTASFLGLAGAGQTIVVLVGGIDFSIPAFISLGAILMSELTGSHGWAFVPALLVIMAFALVLGAVNGYVSHRFRVPPLVVTLGMASVITGGLLVWTHGQQTGSPPTFLGRLSSVNGTTLGIGIPPVVVIWAVVAIVLGVVLRRTLAGRHVYATGSNPVAAELALVRTRRVWVGAFAASALLAALLGVLIAGYAGAGGTTLGDPYLFEGLAAVIVGGTAFGARGDYWRTVLGALVLTVLSTVLVGKGYSSADQQIIFGILILVVVAGYGRELRLRDRI